MEMMFRKSGSLKYSTKILAFVLFIINVCFGNECDECIQSSPEMNFCFHPNFKGRRCGKFDDLKDCLPEYIETNSPSSLTILKDEEFRNFEIFEKNENYIQLKPQKMKLNLRKGEPVNFTFSYKPAENYPLEVYYLMDLTFSMKNDLETLINLGGELGYSLKSISEHFKIAFGSYVDKLRMPFSFTNPDNIENPCNHTPEGHCAKSYLLKHIQNFTNNVELFAREVRKKSNTSANLDDLEGGMEALMQVLLCGRRVGWSDVSRKLVIVSTGSYMHLAGDGILSGTVMKNPGKCLVDLDGNYPADNPYDYPSLGEIHSELRKQKVNIIFAVKEKVLSYYKQMGNILKDFSFVGTLDKDSKNIIQLTKDGYMDFFKKAKFSVDSNHSADLDIKFYADCDGRGFVETSECSNVVLDNVIDFIVEVKLNKVPEDVKKEKLYIVEKNIQERIEVGLEYHGFCRCNAISEQTDEKLCINGNMRCGKCNCHYGWTGDSCNETCSYSLDPCRKEVDGVKETSCSRRGDCECGKCICDFPYQGKYCEYKCPTYKGKICAGHGKCGDNESCTCDSGYTGKDCSCEDSTRSCMVFGKICNDHGTCECNKCICNENYKGRKCEYYIGKTGGSGFCSEFINSTLSFVENGTTQLFYGNISIKPMSISKDVKLAGEGICFARLNNKSHYCEINYNYNLDRQPIILKIQPFCYKRVNAAMVVPAIVFGIIGIGILAVMIWKYVTSRQDRLEYERFQKEVDHQQRSRIENPLYTSPITSYRVPNNSTKRKIK
ncbi:integrin beta-nu-like [Harmonia axyridis]|uniref:integrin beta-nu-like n=1 Tax=Harmonia axyridis TaxID=115357 RepID=UPI001E275643|nr:integrin beta-nu-like [Harmonia axyridis]